jgi:hypothetical protein
MSNRKPPAAGRGRVRGVPNRTTATVREVLTRFVEHNAAGAQALYDRVSKRNPGKALEIFARVAEFVLPRLQRTELRLPSAPLPAEITDANEAASIYTQIMGDPSLDATDIEFAIPAPAQIEQRPVNVEQHVIEPVPEPATSAGAFVRVETVAGPPLTELQQKLKNWEVLGQDTPPPVEEDWGAKMAALARGNHR